MGMMEPVPYRDAVTRVTAYCASNSSGWATYDLPGIVARNSGFFETVTPWSILAANALSARIAQKQVAEFTYYRRKEFAHKLSCVPADIRLGDLDRKQVSAVIDLASYGFKGAWAPTITKLAALYRPHAVPVLDSQVATAFGFQHNAFRIGRQRRARVEEAISLISEWHRRPENIGFLESLRADVRNLIPEIDLISDVRLVDIVLWTTQDDIASRRIRKEQAWVDMPIRDPAVRLASAEAVPLGAGQLGGGTQ